MIDMLKIYDEVVIKTFLNILEVDTSSCSPERIARASLKASLPQPHGCAVFKAADHASIAWIASVSSCLTDPVLFDLRDGLRPYFPFAVNSLIAMQGGLDSEFWLRLTSIIPPDVAGFLDGSVFSPSLPLPKAKITRMALRNIGRRKIKLFELMTSPGFIGPTLTPADVIDSTACSDSSRIFAEPIKNLPLPFGFPNDDYIAFVRFFLGLPPPITIGSLSQVDGFDYAVQKCQDDHGVHTSPYLDASAIHASSNCPSASLARIRKHTNLIRVLAKFAREAGVSVQCEPETYSLLLGEFGKFECRRLFPKKATAHYKEQFDKMLELLHRLTSEECTLAINDKQRLIRQQLDTIPALGPGDTTGLRIDLSMENPATGEVRWVDVTGVHTTSPSYSSVEMTLAQKRRLASLITQQSRLAKPPEIIPSPTILHKERAKEEKYRRLLLVAKKQATEGKRSTAPAFHPFVISDCGEVGPAGVQLQEWLVGCFRSRIADVPRTDGLKLPDLLRDFRRRLKLTIQFALAAGIGAMINTAGQSRMLL
jgi:hypothetical protein